MGLELEHCQACSKAVSTGLRVLDVVPDRVAARSQQIRIGDVIIYIQDQSVERIPVPDLAEALSQFSKGLEGAIPLTLPLRVGLLRVEPGENVHGGKTWTEFHVKLLNRHRDVGGVVTTLLSSSPNFARPASVKVLTAEQARRQLSEQPSQHAEVRMNSRACSFDCFVTSAVLCSSRPSVTCMPFLCYAEAVQPNGLERRAGICKRRDTVERST